MMMRSVLRVLSVALVALSCAVSVHVSAASKVFPQNFTRDLVESRQNQGGIIELEAGNYYEDCIDFDYALEIVGSRQGKVVIHSTSYVQFTVRADFRLQNIEMEVEKDSPLYQKVLGILTLDGNVVIDDCVFSGYQNVLNADSPGEIEIYDSKFRHNNHGISILRSPAVIENNHFLHNNHEGVVLMHPDIVFRKNVVTKNKGGGIFVFSNVLLDKWNGCISFEDNQVFDNERFGIDFFFLDGYKVAPVGDMGGGGKSKGKNKIKNNGEYEVMIEGGQTIYAMDNTWEYNSSEKEKIKKKVKLLRNARIILDKGDVK